MKYKLFVIAIVVILLVLGLLSIMGDGGFKRMVTISGVYSVRSNDYPVVCFMDADSNQGGLSCLSLATIEGCKK